MVRTKIMVRQIPYPISIGIKYLNGIMSMVSKILIGIPDNIKRISFVNRFIF